MKLSLSVRVAEKFHAKREANMTLEQLAALATRPRVPRAVYAGLASGRPQPARDGCRCLRPPWPLLAGRLHAHRRLPHPRKLRPRAGCPPQYNALSRSGRTARCSVAACLPEKGRRYRLGTPGSRRSCRARYAPSTPVSHPQPLRGNRPLAASFGEHWPLQLWLDLRTGQPRAMWRALWAEMPSAVWRRTYSMCICKITS